MPFNPPSQPTTVVDTSPSTPRESVDTQLLAAISVGMIVTGAAVALAVLLGARVYYLRKLAGGRSPKVTPQTREIIVAWSPPVVTHRSPLEETAMLMDRRVSALEKGEPHTSRSSVPSEIQSEEEGEGDAVKRLFRASTARARA